MTRFVYDQFYKDYLDGFLNKCGSVEIDKRVSSEVKQIDVWFVPNPDLSAHRSTLGFLGRMAATRSIFEPFHSPATPGEICDCMVKLRYVCNQEQREANRSRRQVAWQDFPRLWVLTPTASKGLLSGLNAKLDKSWESGVYTLGKTLRTAIVVIHQLPENSETLWLRLMGNGSTQSRAIEELKALPPEHPNREMTLELLLNFYEHLSEDRNLDEAGSNLVMQLEPLLDKKLEKKFQEGEQQGIQQGEQRGRRIMIESGLQVSFGELDAELASVAEQMVALPPEDTIRLIMQLPQLSRSDLLARFSKPAEED